MNILTTHVSPPWRRGVLLAVLKNNVVYTRHSMRIESGLMRIHCVPTQCALSQSGSNPVQCQSTSRGGFNPGFTSRACVRTSWCTHRACTL